MQLTYSPMNFKKYFTQLSFFNSNSLNLNLKYIPDFREKIRKKQIKNHQTTGRSKHTLCIKSFLAETIAHRLVFQAIFPSILKRADIVQSKRAPALDATVPIKGSWQWVWGQRRLQMPYTDADQCRPATHTNCRSLQANQSLICTITDSKRHADTSRLVGRGWSKIIIIKRKKDIFRSIWHSEFASHST